MLNMSYRGRSITHDLELGAAGLAKIHDDPNRISQLERQFLLGVGSAFAYLKTIDPQEYKRFVVEILSVEGLESSGSRGRSSIGRVCKSSIKKRFGWTVLQGGEPIKNLEWQSFFVPCMSRLISR